MLIYIKINSFSQLIKINPKKQDKNNHSITSIWFSCSNKMPLYLFLQKTKGEILAVKLTTIKRKELRRNFNELP